MNNQRSTMAKSEIREKSAKTLSFFRSARQLQIKAGVVISKLNQITSAANAANRAGAEIAISFSGSDLICKIGTVEEKVNINSHSSIPELCAVLSTVQALIPLKHAFLQS